MWRHIGQVDDGAVISHKSGGQGQWRVFHPETLLSGLLEGKQHALGLRHLPAKHQAGAALLRCGCNLGVDQVHACGELDARQIKLGCVLGVAAAAANQGEGQQSVDKVVHSRILTQKKCPQKRAF